MTKRQSFAEAPSSNWAKLQQTLPKPDPSEKGKKPIRDLPKRRTFTEKAQNMRGVKHYLGGNDEGKNGESSCGVFCTREKEGLAETMSSKAGARTVPVRVPAKTKEAVTLLPLNDIRPITHELREMVAGTNVLNEAQRAPGTYLAIDCEMVGLGHMGSESALARVSIVNYHGHIVLDTFVQPRERVTDWRTWVSGVRESDLVGAPMFDEVQKKVAELVDGRIIVGHAIQNDLKALLLSHPGPMVRDTQTCKALREKAKNKRPGLKKLAELELGLQIQKGAHSSVTDARATMALYRLHKIEWEKQLRPVTEAYRDKMGLPALPGQGKPSKASQKRKRDDADGSESVDGDGSDAEDDDDNSNAGGRSRRSRRGDNPGGGRKGVSSGLSTIVYRKGVREQPKGLRDGSTGQLVDSGGRAGGKSGGGGNWWEDAA